MSSGPISAPDHRNLIAPDNQASGTSSSVAPIPQNSAAGQLAGDQRRPPSPGLPRYVVLTGNPNSGKTTVFNGLTGMRAKVGNYAGVTVERKEGRLLGASAELNARVLDLPG